MHRGLAVIVGSCAAFVVVSAQTPAKSEKVPITTASEEARKLYEHPANQLIAQAQSEHITTTIATRRQSRYDLGLKT